MSRGTVEIAIFGSESTGLVLPWSDLDMLVVPLDHGHSSDEEDEEDEEDGSIEHVDADISIRYRRANSQPPLSSYPDVYILRFLCLFTCQSIIILCVR